VVVYFTDRVIEELGRIGENQMTMGWPAARLARADDEDDLGELVLDVVVEEFARLLGLDPHTVDPGYPDEE
jgi:predicted Zn-dependent protease with MMP-like domain